MTLRDTVVGMISEREYDLTKRMALQLGLEITRGRNEEIVVSPLVDPEGPPGENLDTVDDENLHAWLRGYEAAVKAKG